MAGSISGAFGGLLAAGITQMDGLGGIAGWRWIFIIEGLAAVVIGIGSAVCLIDLPSKSMGWLEPAELRYLEISRMIKQGGVQSDGDGKLFLFMMNKAVCVADGPTNLEDIEGGELSISSLYEIKMVSQNWQIWLTSLVCICGTAGSYGQYSSQLPLC